LFVRQDGAFGKMAGTEQPELLIFAALLVTAIWYACSTSITLFSKKWLNEYDFSYPFFIVARPTRARTARATEQPLAE
jgi:hypothetical protein